MTKTPLLDSSIESFVHGIEHYFLVYGHSNKFPLLHIDQSIELLLKAKIQNMNGLSIYTKKGKTIDYHECFNRLEQKDIKIPEKSLLEEIHDKRNLSQHLGASFDDYTIGYYIKFTHSFFKFFLKEHFDDELEAYLPDNIKTYLDNIIVEPTKIHEDQLQYINELIEEGRYKDSIISSWNAIEFLIRGYSDRDTGKSIDEIIRSIKEKKQIDDGKPFEYLEEVKTLKDNIIFSNEEVDQETAIGIHDKIIDIANTNIVIVPVKTAEKISSKRISSDEDAEPVRIIDDTSPVDDIQELYYTTLKLYNSSNKYCSNFEEIFSLYKSRHQLTIDEHSGYEFLTQSSIYHKLPFWYWAKNLTDDEISKIIKRNLDTWPYNTVYYSLDVLLLLSN
jgi:HEPN domain-containing protein